MEAFQSVNFQYFPKEAKYIQIDVELSALRTTKTSEERIRIAESLPSILGIDFLKNNKFSLHVILTEDLAFLQYEG